MENDKCPFCGADKLPIPQFGFSCGSYTMRGWETSGQTRLCKLIVANRELEERHKSLVEAAKESIIALGLASTDIGQLLQVARYNLTGECCGQIMPKPDPPELVHSNGITESEAVIAECNRALINLRKAVGG